MHKASEIVAVELRYEFAGSAGDHLVNPFFRVLAAVRAEGSIAGAAKRLGHSYRHLWGYLREQEQRLGRSLIHWDKGRAARLTDFAEKLLWAETRIRARLAPQIENLATEIGRELTVAFNDQVLIATCAASHDLALPSLRRLCQEQGGLLLDITFAGSLEALHALRRHRCAFAGIHLPLGRPELAQRGSSVHRGFGPLLRLGQETMIRVCTRTQGLHVAPGNPLGVAGIDDLRRVRFVNRPDGTGTRALFEDLIREAGIPAETIAGYGNEESTHVAVAAAVASGAADAGFGIEAAAAQMGLGFVPLVEETYFLVCEAETIDSPTARHLIDVLASPQWREAVCALPGYGAKDAGEVVSLRRTLPWYR